VTASTRLLTQLGVAAWGSAGGGTAAAVSILAHPLCLPDWGVSEGRPLFAPPGLHRAFRAAEAFLGPLLARPAFA
jgi:hypothetical protein